MFFGQGYVPRMGVGPGATPNTLRERIGPGGQVSNAQVAPPPQAPSQLNQMPPMMQGLGAQSQSVFQNYMKGIFNNPYMPPPVPGVFGQGPGGYSGFMPPDMGIFRSPTPNAQSMLPSSTVPSPSAFIASGQLNNPSVTPPPGWHWNDGHWVSPEEDAGRP